MQSLKDEGIHVDTKELKGFTLEEKLPKGNHQGPNKWQVETVQLQQFES